MDEAGLEQNVDITTVGSESDVCKRVSVGGMSENSEGSFDTADEDDIDKMLGELQEFQEELELKSQAPNADDPLSTVLEMASDPLDQFRFSVNAIEGSGEVDLDALLEDLCAMERDINCTTQSTETDAIYDNKANKHFSDPPMSPISPTAKVTADVRNRLVNVQEESKELTLEEQQERIKAEKIRIALEKLRTARIKKLVIKVYNDEDQTSKTLAIDQTWTSWEVCKKMMKKNDTEPDPNWVLVERMPDLYIERLLEDHESVVDVVSTWPWDSNNKLVLNNRREKYALFRNPQNYLLTSDTSTGAAQLAEKSKDILLTEYFKKDAMRLPELDGILYLREGKKSWKKHYFALRASGVYFNPKGKTKSSKDLVCLIKPEYVGVYNGFAIKKKLKAPTDHCFVLKSHQHNSLDSKAIVCLCAEDQRTVQRWMVAIRIAKYGYRMLEDYSETQDEMDKLAFTLDRTRFTRNSFSAPSSSPAEPEQQPQPAPKDYSLKMRMQSERLKQAAAHQAGFPGSASFSVRRAGKESSSKNPAKNISNLFSDAWKKGTEVKHFESSSPEYASVGPSPGGIVTPNTTSPKSFVIEANRAIRTLEDVKEDEDSESELAYPAASAWVESELVLEPPPLPRKHFESSSPEYESVGTSPDGTGRTSFVTEGNRDITLDDDVKEAKDSEFVASAWEESEPPPLPRKLSGAHDQSGAVYEEIRGTQGSEMGLHRSESRSSRQGSPPPAPIPPPYSDTPLAPPPPPVPSTPRPSMTAHPISPGTEVSNSCPPPLPTSPRPLVGVPLSPTIPVDLCPRSTPHSPQPQEFFSPPPPPPKAKHMNTIPPPSPLSVDPPSLHSSTDSLPPPPPPAQFTVEDIPLPPPPVDPPGGDADFPPPPSDVILKEQISASLLRRTQSSKAPPPPPPPKTNRRRLSNRSASFT